MYKTLNEFKKEYPNFEYFDFLESEFNRILNNDELFPIKPIESFLLESDYNNFSQCFRTEDDRNWVIVQYSNWEHQYNLKDMFEIISEIKRNEKYSKYNFKDKYLEGINFIVKTINGDEYSRSSLTYKEYKEVLDKEGVLDSYEREEKTYKNIIKLTEEWLHSVPHIEKPFKIYVDGGDDLCYSKVFETEKEMMNIINSWKEKGFFNVKDVKR